MGLAAPHVGHPRAPGPWTRAGGEVGDARVPGVGRAATAADSHLERRGQRPHDRNQRGDGLPGFRGSRPVLGTENHMIKQWDLADDAALASMYEVNVAVS